MYQNVEEVCELFEALHVIRKFKIRNGDLGVGFVKAEEGFVDLLGLVKNGIVCPHCSRIIKFNLKN